MPIFVAALHRQATRASTKTLWYSISLPCCQGSPNHRWTPCPALLEPITEIKPLLTHKLYQTTRKSRWNRKIATTLTFPYPRNAQYAQITLVLQNKRSPKSHPGSRCGLDGRGNHSLKDCYDCRKKEKSSEISSNWVATKPKSRTTLAPLTESQWRPTR